MRIRFPILIFLAASVCCQAQTTVSLKAYSGSETVQRINTKVDMAMEAANEYASGKETKGNPALKTPFDGKAFAGGGNFAESGRSGKMAPFLYEEKVSSREFKTTRSFFGIKNPWIGREVPEVKAAPLMARGILPADKTFAAEDVETRALPGTARDAFPDKADVPTRGYLGKGKAQGAVTQLGGQLTKEMSIEEVREILNKNR